MNEDGRGRLAGKIALVAGAGSRRAESGRVGTGRAISVLFAREGAVVGLLDYDRDRALETLTALEGEGGEGFVLQGDVTSERDCRRVVAELLERFGSLDVLVNNVVSWEGSSTPITEITEESWDRQLSLGLKGVVLLCKHAIPAMIDTGGGSIISVASVAGMVAHGTPGYGAAKAGMIMLTRDLAFQYGKDGIRANVLSPGHIFTDGADAPMTPLRAWRTQVAPLGVEGTAWDVAWAAVFLGSDESRYISGYTMPIDGGVTQLGPMMARSDIIGGDWGLDEIRRRPAIAARGEAS
jgi:NAD(P)-dependent dehydrogenase (short-subunit alcohol dehydrogenase family)